MTGSPGHTTCPLSTLSLCSRAGIAVCLGRSAASLSDAVRAAAADRGRSDSRTANRALAGAERAGGGRVRRVDGGRDLYVRLRKNIHIRTVLTSFSF